MTDADRKLRNTTMLKQCWPSFAARVRRVLDAMEADGFKPRIQQAWRSEAEQLEAFRTGHSKLRWGFHNATGKDGTPEALAVDVIDDKNPLASGPKYCVALAHYALDNALVSGILWGLPASMGNGVYRAISEYPFGVIPPRIGWDPTHLEPRDINVAAAKAGKRPA